eukprot:gene4310-7666_t
MTSNKKYVEELSQKMKKEKLDLFLSSLNLYKSDSHFIKEILQNFDENTYLNRSPSCSIYIQQNFLIFTNNEIGFSKEDVDNFCTIGKSRKQESKGIGLKSIFRITDKVFLVSNDFQISLTSTKKNQIIDNLSVNWLKTIPVSKKKLQNTNIIIPWKNKNQMKNISNFLKNINIEFLLFTKNLQKIEIFDETSNEKITFQVKHEKKNTILKLSKNDFNQIFTYKICKIESLENGKNFEINFGFHMTEEYQSEPKLHNIYSNSIPIRSYGFPFLINSNFRLTFNKEDIDQDDEFNKMIKENIVDEFLDFTNFFKTQNNLKYDWYNYIPIENELTEEFKDTSREIIEKLKNVDSILTETDNWKKPSEVIFWGDFPKTLISNDDLSDFFELEYINESLIINLELLDQLGISYLSLDHLLKCLGNETWVKSHDDLWFQNLYRFLGMNLKEFDSLEIFEKIKIVRLENDEIVNIDKNTSIYFPINSESLKIINNLKMVKPTVLYSSSGIIDSFSLKFLEKIGVKKESTATIIIKDILPIYQNCDVKDYNQIDIEKHLEHSFFIRNHMNEIPNDLIEEIRKNFLILTQENEFDFPTYIYLSSFYQFEEEPTLEELLPDGKFISSKYLEYSIKNNLEISIEVTKWRDFFEELLVPLSPSISKIEYDLDPLESLKLKLGSSGAQIIDFEYTKDFENLFQNENLIEKALEFIDYHWNYYSNFSEKRILIKDQRIINLGVDSISEDSSMLNFLKNQKVKASNKIITKISNLWYGNLISIYGSNFPFFAGNLLNINFRHSLGLFEELNISNLIKQLLKLKKRTIEENFTNKNQIKSEFNAFLKLFSSLYNKNLSLLYDDEIIEKKLDNGVIYFQFSKKIKKNLRDTFTKEESLIFIQGDWLFSSQLFWEENDILFSNLKSQLPSLKNYFEMNESNLFKNFLLAIGVLEKKPYTKFIHHLDKLLKEYVEIQQSQQKKKKKKEIFQEYFKLNDFIKLPSNEKDELKWIKDNFEKLPLLLTSKGTFVSLKKNEIFYYNKEDKIYNCFKNEINLVLIEDDSIENLKDLLKYLSVYSFNSVLKTEVENEKLFILDEKETLKFKKLFLYLERYLHLNKLESIFNQDYQKKFQFLQNKFKIKTTNEKLKIVYNHKNSKFILSGSCKFQISNYCLFISNHSETKPSIYDVLNELIQILDFPKDEEFKSFFFTIFSINNPEEYMKFMGYLNDDYDEDYLVNDCTTLENGIGDSKNVLKKNLDSEIQKQEEFFKMIEEMVEHSLDEEEKASEEILFSAQNDYEFNMNYLMDNFSSIEEMVEFEDEIDENQENQLKSATPKKSPMVVGVRQSNSNFIVEEEISKLFSIEEEEEHSTEMFVKNLFESTNYFKMELQNFVSRKSMDSKGFEDLSTKFQISQSMRPVSLSSVLKYEMKRLKSYTLKNTNEFVIDLSTFEKKENFKNNLTNPNLKKYFEFFNNKINYHVISINPQTLFFERIILITDKVIELEYHEFQFGERSEFLKEFFFMSSKILLIFKNQISKLF